jgi:hypothetical protein
MSEESGDWGDMYADEGPRSDDSMSAEQQIAKCVKCGHSGSLDKQGKCCAKVYRTTDEATWRHEFCGHVCTFAPEIAPEATPPERFVPAPETEASRNDPEERLCVACGRPAWAHSCNRPPLSSVNSIDTLKRRVTELQDENAVLKSQNKVLASCVQMPSCAHCRGEIGVILTTVADQGIKDRKVEELKKALAIQNQCVICSAELLPPTEPPHCKDCVVTDEVQGEQP